jgi:hypothetical protein
MGGFDGILFVSSMMIRVDLEAFLLKAAFKSGLVLILKLGSAPLSLFNGGKGVL